eukprot:588657-Rhodomonas_salina.3
MPTSVLLVALRGSCCSASSAALPEPKSIHAGQLQRCASPGSPGLACSRAMQTLSTSAFPAIAGQRPAAVTLAKDLAATFQLECPVLPTKNHAEATPVHIAVQTGCPRDAAHYSGSRCKDGRCLREYRHTHGSALLPV